MVTRQEMRKAAAAFGKEGGKKRARNMTPEQRSEAARKAVEARWARTGKLVDRTKVLEKKVKAEQKRRNSAD